MACYIVQKENKLFFIYLQYMCSDIIIVRQ